MSCKPALNPQANAGPLLMLSVLAALSDLLSRAAQETRLLGAGTRASNSSVSGSKSTVSGCPPSTARRWAGRVGSTVSAYVEAAQGPEFTLCYAIDGRKLDSDSEITGAVDRKEFWKDGWGALRFAAKGVEQRMSDPSRGRNAPSTTFGPGLEPDVYYRNGDGSVNEEHVLGKFRRNRTRPIAKFIFKCRTRAQLQAKGYILRDPSPSPSVPRSRAPSPSTSTTKEKVEAEPELARGVTLPPPSLLILDSDSDSDDEIQIIECRPIPSASATQHDARAKVLQAELAVLKKQLEIDQFAVKDEDIKQEDNADAGERGQRKRLKSTAPNAVRVKSEKEG